MNINELEWLAQAATPGPWRTMLNGEGCGHQVRVDLRQPDQRRVIFAPFAEIDDTGGHSATRR